MNISPKVIERANELDALIHAVRDAGLTVPAALTEAVRVSDELADISVETDVPARMVDASRDLREQLEEQAALRSRITAQRTVAEELRAPAIGVVDQNVRAAIPAWISDLQDRFTTIVEAMRTAVLEVPRVSAERLGDLSPEQFVAWQTFAGHVRAASDVLGTRAAIVRVRNEDGANATGNMLLPVVAAITVPEHFGRVGYDDLGMTMRGEIADLHRERYEPFMTLGLAGSQKSNVEAWLELLDAEKAGWIRLHLAAVSDLPKRCAILNWWQQIPFGTAASGHARVRADYESDTVHEHSTKASKTSKRRSASNAA